MIEVRRITAEEYGSARGIWDICFEEDAGAYAEYYFASRTSCENVIAAFDGGRMVGCLHIIPERIWVAGVLRPVGMIAGVGTLPERRGQGIARAMLERAKRELTQIGAYGAMLQPVNTAYYTGSGFVPYCTKGTYFITGEGRLRSDPEPDRLLSIYRSYAAGFDGMRERSEEDMRLLMEEWRITGCSIAVRGGAYAVYYVKEDTAHTVEMAGEGLELLARAIAGGGGARCELPEGGETFGERISTRVFSMMAHLEAPREERPVCSLEYC